MTNLDWDLPERLLSVGVETQLHDAHAYGSSWTDAFPLVHVPESHALPEGQARDVTLVETQAQSGSAALPRVAFEHVEPSRFTVGTLMVSREVRVR
jgi:hypothetical protein